MTTRLTKELKRLMPEVVFIDGCQFVKRNGKWDTSHLRRGDPPAFKLKQYLKGCQALIMEASSQGYCERAAGAFTGNANTVEEKFRKLFNQLKESDLIRVGADEGHFCVTSYVDGSYGVCVN